MSAGLRSPLLPLGIVGSPAPSVTGGARSFLAHWLGGASAPRETPLNPPGVRSMLAFWIGGACATTLTSGRGGDNSPFRRLNNADIGRLTPEEEEEEIIAICAAWVKLRSG